jgi:hypothetical protein
MRVRERVRESEDDRGRKGKKEGRKKEQERRKKVRVCQ